MTGDQADMLSRLKSVLPVRWFGDVTPNLDALLNGFASAWNGLNELLGFVRAQARISSSSGIFLDIAGTDYFGNGLPRRAGESDVSYSVRLRDNLLCPRATRLAIVQALYGLTGRNPMVFEPLNATDTGGYNAGSLGYGVAGGYGSRALPFQYFVTAYRPNATPVSNVGGYNLGPGGYNQAPMSFANVSDILGAIADADIYAAIRAVAPAASVAWVKISN